MGAALSILVLLSLSVFIVRVSSVALRLTGLAETSARFQALSAFTGTGFTTAEAETVVNYPIRRRIVSLLMIVGNMGLVTVFAALVASLVQTDGEVGAVIVQLVWFLGGLALLWFLMLNSTADRIMCSFIGKILESTTLLGKRSFQRMLQIGDGYSVCEHLVAPHLLKEHGNLVESDLEALELTVLAVRSPSGKLSVGHPSYENINTGDTLVLFGRDAGHEALGCITCRSEPDSHTEPNPTGTDTNGE